MVLIDTSAWIDFFHDQGLDSPVGREVDSLLAEGRVVTTGMVLAELLQGASDIGEIDYLRNLLGALDFVEAGRDVWQTAGRWSYELLRQGLATPLSDLVIAAAAASADHEVFTTDRHFGRVQGLSLHRLPQPDTLHD